MSIVRDAQRMLSGALFVLVVALAGYGWYQGKRADAQQVAAQVATGDARAATVYVTAHKAAIQSKEKKDAETAAVLARNVEWADAPLPGDVADLLRHPTGTTRAVP